MNNLKFMPTLIENTGKVLMQSLTSFVEESDCFNGKLPLSEVLLQFTEALQEASNECCRSGLVEFIEAQEEAVEVIERDGKKYRYKNSSNKPFLSIFGPINVTRRTYHHWAGGSGFVPLDEQINMTGRYVMPDVVESLLYGAAMLTPKELESMLDKVSAFNPSASLIQDIINEDGKAFDNFLHDPDRDDHVRAITLPDKPVDALVASFDGVNVLVRESGKKRGAHTKKPAKDFNDGQAVDKSCSYKNAMIGAISFYRSAEVIADNVIDITTGEPKLELEPERISSTYIGRMPEERYPTFKAEFERAITQAELAAPANIAKILLMDGARGFWKYVSEKPMYDDYIKIVDFYHAAEHLSSLAEALFGKSSMDAQKWFEKWVSKLKHENEAVIAMLRSAKRYFSKNKLSPSRIKDYHTECTFFQRNKERMSYNKMKEQGLPIGSGPVESACKMIVKQRLCQSGMRWSSEGGQNVMNLRVVQKSDQWDDTWRAFKNAGGYHSHFKEAA